MSEYRIHQDINLFEIADEYAKRLQEHVDELALDMAAETLAKYGYVKVVRCRDCVYMREQTWNAITATGLWCVEHDIPVNADGFCAWAIKRTGAENG